MHEILTQESAIFGAHSFEAAEARVEAARLCNELALASMQAHRAPDAGRAESRRDPARGESRRDRPSSWLGAAPVKHAHFPIKRRHQTWALPNQTRARLLDGAPAG